ncbi:hypothetical protein ACHWQZ_G011758 [Mnemiopsis leidyi]
MRYLVLGGGVAGTTVAENLHIFDQTAHVTLISATETVKKVTNLEKKGEVIDSFEVIDSSPHHQCYHFICGLVTKCDFQLQTVTLADGKTFQYDKLCIATGARPNVIFPNIPHVVGIRDTESVQDLQNRLKTCKHVTVVGNGGIASEFVFAAKHCQISWVIKDETITSVFVDSVASKFLLDSMKGENDSNCNPERVAVSKRQIYSTVIKQKNGPVLGSALGPDWYNGFSLDGTSSNKKLEIEYGCQIENVSTCSDDSDYNLKIELTNGQALHSDVLVSATGVIPNSDLFKDQLNLSETDQGIIVDKRMRTSAPNVYAAGDICSIPWKECENWKQMRLWTQALQQGFYTACSMSASDDEVIEPDMSFEIFTHSTKLFGYKVIMLGRYQEWEGCRCYFRISPGLEFVKLVVSNDRIQGALLIGETDLEEVMENLILNQTDISQLGESILDPNIDIEDYFD